MSRKALINVILIVLILVLAGGVFAASRYYVNLPENLSQHETIVLGQNRFVPGSEAAIRVVVRDSKDGAPLEGAEIEIAMRPADGGKSITVFSGKTDSQGTTNVYFEVPEDVEPNQTLIIETKSTLGSDIVERPVTVDREYRVLLTTDKPIYQPGQIIHVRALALSDFDLIPAANQSLEIIIADGKGNKVFRETLTTSDFGVAAVDFQLASEVSTGNYKITTALGNVSSEKTVVVEHYVLPKFDVEIETDETFYLPGERVEGTLRANYFYGKPVAGGEVLLEGYIFDVERVVTFSLQGISDEQGNFEFEFALPEYIAGSDLEGGLGRFYLQASVTDLAQHTEIKNASLPVSGSALVIEAIPEGGQFRPGVENILYVLTSYPDGSPAETDLALTFYADGSVIEAQTGGLGLAEIVYVPSEPWQSFSIDARDAMGNYATREFYFEGTWYEETVLLRPDKPVYRVGDSMNLTILTSQPSGTVYLDIVREGQTVSTRSIDVEAGQAVVPVDLTPDMYGTLELHAYKILTSGSIVRDTRLVVVDNIDDLYVEMTPDQEIYLPGETASLDVNVLGAGGEGVQSVLGLAIVDESVFALAEQDPGFAKLYFMLEQEILQPRFELHGFSVPDLVSGVPVSSDEMVSAIEDAAQASLAAAIPETIRFSLEANSREDNLQRAYTRQEEFFSSLSKGLFGLSILMALGVVVLSVLAVSRDKVLGRSILMMFSFLFWLLVIFLLLPLSDYYWGVGLLDRLGAFMDYMNYEGEGVVIILGLLGIAGFIVLAVYAGVKKDPLLGWMLAALILLLALLAALIFATAMSDIYPADGVVILGMFAILLVPLAFLLRFSGFTMSWKVLPALAMLPLTLLLLVGILPTFGVGMSSGVMARQVGNDFMMLDAAEMEVGAVFEEAEAAPVMGAMPEEPAMEMSGEAKESVDADEGASAAEAPRLRQYFPETMFWMPDALTDEHGSLTLEIPVADSITTWRITALASSQDGRLGSTTGWMKVFQDFFIDLDLPLSLTVGDEISVPVGVFNYMAESQTVKLELQQEDWFELLDEPVKEITIAANDISVVYFRVRALDFGRQPFQVTALGSKMSDAILKEVRVYPDGKQIRFSRSDRLSSDEVVSETVNIPADAIPGTQTLVVKIYPGVVSQIVEGLDSILRMPFGCFEQTSSTTYPNVLVMDYLKTSGQISPEVQMKAEEYINLGYQRLTTFEVGGSGGFSLFGDAPADPMLTAYGLQEFNDMSRVHNVDPAIIQRIAAWLQSQQKPDGSWEGVSGFHETGLTNMVERLPVSAYVVWGLADAGYGEDASTQLGAQYLREFQSQADDAYALALVANALVAVDVSTSGEISSTTTAVLDRLAGMAIKDGNVAYWQNETETVMGSYGDAGALETTALAALALLRSDAHPDLANAALTYLVQGKDSFGTWDTTQATVMSLKAFLESVRGGSEDVNAEVTVTLNGGQTRTAQVTPQNFDMVQYLVFDDINIGRDNVVEIVVSGEGNLMYQVAGSYYLPWETLSMYPDVIEGGDLVTIDVRYDRTEISVNDMVEVTVKVSLNEMDGVAESALIDLGLPPGFTVQAEDLAALVNYYNDVPKDYGFPTIQRYELTGRQIIVYISNLSYEHPMEFSYRLLAKFPLQVQTPASTAYDYYNPAVSGEAQPLMLLVAE